MKKIALILDNAPYHHVRGDTFVDPLRVRRAELIDSLIEISGSQIITVTKAEKAVTFDLKEAKQKRPAEGLMKQSKAILGVSHMISIVAI